jgi:fission process protein 1
VLHGGPIHRRTVTSEVPMRYLGYFSDIGESFRPVIPLAAVRSCYGVSWAYCFTDIYLEAQIEKEDNGVKGSALARIVFERTLFQSIATMALPALTIHTCVHQAQKHLFKNTTNPRIKHLGPTVMGMCVVPFLPFMYDHPVERVLGVFMRNVWPKPKEKSE